MMAANYRHIGGGVNRLGRHYSRFSGFWPTPFLIDQSLALRKSRNTGSNRPRRASLLGFLFAECPGRLSISLQRVQILARFLKWCSHLYIPFSCLNSARGLPLGVRGRTLSDT